MAAESQVSAALGRAYHAALLLTGNVFSAERAVLTAIHSLDPQHCNAEACLSQTVENSIQRFGDPVEITTVGVADDSLNLPVELRRVMRMESTLRYCFVVRVLLGFSEKDSARLLQLQPSEVTVRTAEAIEWLARLPETGIPWISALPGTVEQDPSSTRFMGSFA